MASALWGEVVNYSALKLCLCDPCCGDPGDRWFARRSRGLHPGPDGT